MASEYPWDLVFFIGSGCLAILFRFDWSMNKRIVYVTLFTLPSLLVYSLLEPEKEISFFISLFIVMIIFFILRERFVSTFKKRGKTFDQIMSLNVDTGDKEIADYILKLKTNICELAERCMVAISYGDFSEASRISRIMSEKIGILRDHRLAYYLRLVINIYDDTLSKTLDKHKEHLQNMPLIVEKHPREILKALEALIFSIYPEYSFGLIIFDKNSIDKQKNTPFHKRSQYDQNEILRKNFELWKKYVPSGTQSNSYFLYIFTSFIIILGFLLSIMTLDRIFPILILSFFFFTSFVFLVIPYLVFEQNIDYINWSKDVLWGLFQERDQDRDIHGSVESHLKSSIENNLIRSLRCYIEAAGIIESLDELDRIDSLSTRKLNYSLLVYFITTFPKMKINDFVPLDEENLLDVARNLEFEQMRINDFDYFLQKWKTYNKFMFFVLKRKEKC